MSLYLNKAGEMREFFGTLKFCLITSQKWGARGAEPNFLAARWRALREMASVQIYLSPLDLFQLFLASYFLATLANIYNFFQLFSWLLQAL